MCRLHWTSIPSGDAMAHGLPISDTWREKTNHSFGAVSIGLPNRHLRAVGSRTTLPIRLVAVIAIQTVVALALVATAVGTAL